MRLTLLPGGFTMLRYLLVCVLMVLAALPASAQDRPAAEGQRISQNLGEEKNYVSGARVIRPGFISRTIMRRSVGTMVKVTPLITADRSLTLDLNVEDTRILDSATETVGVDENGNPIPAT